MPFKETDEMFRYFLPYILDVISSYLVKKNISVHAFKMLTYSFLIVRFILTSEEISPYFGSPNCY